MSSISTQKWPLYYPPCCPPAGTRPIKDDIHRLVAAPVPTDQDFLPHVKLHSTVSTWNDVCDASGLSVWISEPDLRQAIARLPGLRKLTGRLRFIAINRMGPSVGEIKCTNKNSKHHTMWHYGHINEFTLMRLNWTVKPL